MQKLLSADDIGAVIALAQRAAKEILAVYETDFAVDHKDDASPVTEADRASDALIQSLLPDVGGKWPVLSEESPEAHDPKVRQQWRTYWCVDPMDGTKDFKNRTGQFAINIGLIHNNEPHWGLVLAPAMNQCWHGGKAYGAFNRDLDANEDQPLTPEIPAHKPLRALISRSHSSRNETSIVDAINASGYGEVIIEKRGSSVKYCAIAQGDVDFMPRFHPCMEWDTAAPQAILEAVGGSVTDLDGNPLKYNRDDMTNPHLVAFADPNLPWREWIASRGE